MFNLMFGSRSWGSVLGLILVLQVGCACRSAAPVLESGSQAPVDLAEANAAYTYADGYQSLKGAILLLERYAAQHPDDYASRARLANAYTLLGAGYSTTVADKATAYAAAMRYGEAAMLTVPAFRAQRAAGESFESALQTLGKAHFEAMEFWKTALFYDFRECTGLLDKLMSYGRLRKAVAVMDRMEQIERQAMWGNNLFSQGIYYLAQPEIVGGDKRKSAAYLAEAAAVSPTNIVPRWGRAKYYAVAMGDRELFRKDLQWVTAQPLDKLSGYRPWNLVLQREALALLANEKQYFSVD